MNKLDEQILNLAKDLQQGVKGASIHQMKGLEQRVKSNSNECGAGHSWIYRKSSKSN
jgi:hypothetical protein